MLQSFWAHVKGTSNVDSLFGVIGRLFCESKICNFGNFVFHENVGRLEIAMQEP